MESESLQPEIKKAQKALASALDEACVPDVEELDTGELIRIEETLAAAGQAAKEAISLRLRRRQHRAAERERSQAASESHVSQRIFDDIRGKRWRVFAVRPSSATLEHSALPESFRQGWLSFEATDEMRRVAPIPEQWEQLSIDDLRLLCHRAGSSPKRLPREGPPDLGKQR